MTMMFSVIIPVYNVLDYLKECLDSVLRQKYDNYEIIIINDGSNDGSEEICKEYNEKYDRIRLFNIENSGLSAAKNLGIDEALGDYIIFVDSDDFIEDNYLINLCSELRNCLGVDIVLINHLIWNQTLSGRGHVHDQTGVLDRKSAVEYMLSKKNFISSWSHIYKNSVFQNIRFPVGRKFEDGYIYDEICEKVKSVLVAGGVYYYYRVRSGSIMNSNWTEKDYRQLLDTHTKLLNYISKDSSRIYILRDRFFDYYPKFLEARCLFGPDYFEFVDLEYKKYINILKESRVEFLTLRDKMKFFFFTRNLDILTMGYSLVLFFRKRGINIQSMLMYFFIGLIASTMDFLIFFILNNYAPYIAVNILSISAGIAISYTLNSRFNFTDKKVGHSSRRLLLFVCVALIGMIISSFLLFLFQKINLLNIGKICSIVVIGFIQYILNSRFTFKIR